jgi:membrane dipeptidase
MRNAITAVGCILAPLLLSFNTHDARSQDASRLHSGAVLVDTHNDFPSASIEKRLPFDADLRGKAHSDLQRMFQGGVDLQVFSIFCGPEQSAPYAWANREIDSVAAWVERNPGRMQWVRNGKDLRKALRSGRLGAMLGVEGGHMIEDDLSKLEALYGRGVRYMTLTWNNSTPWASSALDETTRRDSVASLGLNEFGRKVVRRMNELGMIVDVSHNGERTFWDALKETRKPVIASHSSVYSLCPHRRNLKDEQIRAIAANGGVVHLNFYAGFLDSSYERKSNAILAKEQSKIDSLVAAGMQKDYARMQVAEGLRRELEAVRPGMDVLLDHLDHIVRLVGVDHVGLGSDFDGIEAPPKGLEGVEDFPKITEALKARVYSRKDIRKILGGNFIRVLKANERPLS